MLAKDGTLIERKLAAILAADVAGYSRLMELDEAGTFERLKARRTELVEPTNRSASRLNLQADGRRSSRRVRERRRRGRMRRRDPARDGGAERRPPRRP